MKKEYRNKLITTALLLIGLMVYVVVDSYVRYQPENVDAQVTEQVNDTEIEE